MLLIQAFQLCVFLTLPHGAIRLSQGGDSKPACHHLCPDQIQGREPNRLNYLAFRNNSASSYGVPGSLINVIPQNIPMTQGSLFLFGKAKNLSFREWNKLT